MPKTRKSKVVPAVTLDGPRVVFAGMSWAASPKALDKLNAAGAQSIMAALPDSPGCVLFGTAAEARAVFEAVFNDQDDEWGILYAVPDETRWNDTVGLEGLADSLNRSMK